MSIAIDFAIGANHIGADQVMKFLISGRDHLWLKGAAGHLGHIFHILSMINWIIDQIPDQGPIRPTSSRLKESTPSSISVIEGFVVIPGDPGQQSGLRIIIEIVIMGHDPIGIPVLDHIVDRQIFQEARNIEYLRQSCPPGFRIGGAGFSMKRLIESQNIAVIRLILIGFFIKGSLRE